MSQLQNAWGFGGLGSSQLGLQRNSMLGRYPSALGDQQQYRQPDPWKPITFEDFQAEELFEYLRSGEYTKHHDGPSDVAVSPAIYTPLMLCKNARPDAGIQYKPGQINGASVVIDQDVPLWTIRPVAKKPARVLLHSFDRGDVSVEIWGTA